MGSPQMSYGKTGKNNLKRSQKYHSQEKEKEDALDFQ